MSKSVSKVSRRRFVTLTGAALVAPFIKLGNYRLFAGDSSVYSERAITLVNESRVIDMLSLLDMKRMFEAESTGAGPAQFSRDELLAIRESGIDVFHPAVGLSGPGVQLDAMYHMA